MKSKLILFAVASSLVVACGNNEKNKPEESLANLKTETEVKDRDMKGLKIAFYHSDSVAKYFKFFKEQDALMKKKQLSFQKEVERRTNELQEFIMRNEKRAQSGQLSENEMIQIQQRAQQMEQGIMLYQQSEGSKIEQDVMKKTEILMNKIQAFGKKFSEMNQIDILLMNGKGGQFNYISDEMDVTSEFVNYLNQNQSEIEAEFKK